MIKIETETEWNKDVSSSPETRYVTEANGDSGTVPLRPTAQKMVMEINMVIKYKIHSQ